MRAMRIGIRRVAAVELRRAAASFLVAGLFGNASAAQAHKKSPPAAGGAPAFQGIYTGTIDGKAIVAEIGASTMKADEEPRTADESRHPIEGRYFYRSHRVGILLEG